MPRNARFGSFWSQQRGHIAAHYFDTHRSHEKFCHTRGSRRQRPMQKNCASSRGGLSDYTTHVLDKLARNKRLRYWTRRAGYLSSSCKTKLRKLDKTKNPRAGVKLTRAKAQHCRPGSMIPIMTADSSWCKRDVPDKHNARAVSRSSSDERKLF